MTPMLTRQRFKPRKESTTIAYIGLGSNVGERETTIRAAVERIGHDPAVEVLRVSSLRETDPVGYEEQPPFLNGAAAIATTRSAAELLGLLLDVERGLGRDRRTAERWGPRTIDLDVLLYGDETIDQPGLRVPHPRMHERRFVLEPLAELDPGLVVPGRGRVSDLLAKLK